MDIRKIYKYRDYKPPVLHLEFLTDEEFDIAWQIVTAFETAGVAFACVLPNALNKDVLNLHTYGLISKAEEQNIYNEIIALDELKDYLITLN